MSNNNKSSPQPRSVALLFSRRPLFTRTPGAKLSSFSSQTGPSEEFKFPKPLRSMGPGCIIRINSNHLEEEDDDDNSGEERLAARVHEFLQQQNVHAVAEPSNKHAWKCETLWVKFRIEVMDGNTIQVQRRFGCSCKLCQLKQALLAHLSPARFHHHNPRRSLPRLPKIDCDASIQQEIERMETMMESSNVDSQLLALEAMAECDALLQAPSLASPLEHLCASSHHKVASVAQYIRQRHDEAEQETTRK